MKKIVSTLLLTGFIIPTIGMANITEAESLKIKPLLAVPATLMIISPNGGEILNREKIQKIEWTVDYPIYKGEKCGKENGNGKCFPWSERVSIDLYRRIYTTCTKAILDQDTESCPSYYQTEFVKHIASANLFDGYYNWKINKDIKNGSDYIIRISSETEKIPYETYLYPYPIDIDWDESDNTFTITSKPIPPSPDLTETIRVLDELRTTLEQQIQALIKIIAYLKEIAVTQ